MKELQIIQQKLKAPKGQFNKFAGYYYRSCSDILEAVKPLLGETNCTLIINDEIIEVGGRVYIKATAELKPSEGQSVSASAFAREPENKKGQDESQISGAASSYARKYALNGLFAIDDTADADATNDHGKAAPAAKDDLLDKIIESFSMQDTIEALDAKLAKAKTTPYKDDQRMLDAYNRKATELNTK